MLKSKLLQTDVFIDNVHLDSYVSIVEEGLYKKHKKDVTERHHILPVSYRGKTHAFDGTKKIDGGKRILHYRMVGVGVGDNLS